MTGLALWEAELAADPAGVTSSLIGRLRQIPDRRARRGRRHPLLVVLVLTACATLVVGNDSVAAIQQGAARTSQHVLQRLGARHDSLLDRFTVPSERTFRRVLADLDADALDLATCGYAMDVVRGTAPVPVLPRTPARPNAKSDARRPLPTTIRRRPVCCPTRRWTARRYAAPAPAPAGCSSSRRSPTAAGSSWASVQVTAVNARGQGSASTVSPPAPATNPLPLLTSSTGIAGGRNDLRHARHRQPRPRRRHERHLPAHLPDHLHQPDRPRRLQNQRHQQKHPLQHRSRGPRFRSDHALISFVLGQFTQGTGYPVTVTRLAANP